MMDLFGRKRIEKQIGQLISTMKQAVDMRMQLSNFTTAVAPMYSTMHEQLLYRTMDDVYSVVSRLAVTSAMIPFYGRQQNEELPNANDKILDIEKQLTFEMKEKMYLSLYTTGEIFLKRQVIELGPNAGKTKLYLLNPSFIEVELSKGWPYDIMGYRYNDNKGNYETFRADEVVFIKLENPGFDDEGKARGLSPISVLKHRVTRLQSSMDISVSQLQNGGLPGVLYDESPIFDAAAANMHKENFANFLNNPANKNAPYIMGGKIGYVSIGSTLADLDLAKLADLDFDKICNVYGISSTWFNNHSAATESNVKEMVRQVYTNAVLPNVMRVVDALNEQLVPMVGSTSKLVYDLSDVTELQEDMLAKANAYSAMPVIIPNEVRQGLGFERVDDPLMDLPLVKMGYQTIEDVAAVPNLPITPDYGGQATGA